MKIEKRIWELLKMLLQLNKELKNLKKMKLGKLKYVFRFYTIYNSNVFQNLRCCPKCGRPIEKLEGCDSMKCGKDYHGGNNQKG